MLHRLRAKASDPADFIERGDVLLIHQRLGERIWLHVLYLMFKDISKSSFASPGMPNNPLERRGSDYTYRLEALLGHCLYLSLRCHLEILYSKHNLSLIPVWDPRMHQHSRLDRFPTESAQLRVILNV